MIHLDFSSGTPSHPKDIHVFPRTLFLSCIGGLQTYHHGKPCRDVLHVRSFLDHDRPYVAPKHQMTPGTKGPAENDAIGSISLVTLVSLYPNVQFSHVFSAFCGTVATYISGISVNYRYNIYTHHIYVCIYKILYEYIIYIIFRYRTV